jgi:peptidoglycan/LPS O-acetylase OafA/YrhL
MVAEGQQRLNGLDHLRAFAIAYVFLNHYSNLFPHPKWLEGVGGFGWTGVDLFFVLSGYLIGGQLLRSVANAQPISIPEFYIKRFFRIIPAYLTVLALYFTLPALRETTGIQPLWKFLTFTENLGFDAQLGRSFSHAWSLCVEEHFYLLFPVLVVLLSVWRMPREAIWIAAAVFLGGIAVRVYCWNVLAVDYTGWYKWIYYPTYSRLDGLLVGVCAAATQTFSSRRWRQLTQHPYRVLALGPVLIIGGYVLSAERKSLVSSVFSFPLISLGYGLVLVSAVSPESFLHRIGLRLTAFLAAVSYSLYLIHKITICVSQTMLSNFEVDVQGTLAFLVCIAVSLAGAWALHVGVERPFMQLRSVVLANRKRTRSESPEYEVP